VTGERDAVEQLAEEFLERYRRGERPSVSEYASAYPDLAASIRELFPAIAMLENMGDAGSADLSRRLGDFRILREVGRGGMGVVYEAVQVSLGRHVALKVLPRTGLGGDTGRERFLREARAAALLHHPNIVPVFGVGEHDGVHYYAMQFIAGQGLDSVLRQVQAARGQAKTRAGEATSGAGSVPGLSSSGSRAAYFRNIARLGEQVARALAYAHEQGVLHRDIKPSNLILDTKGTPWVADFGLAKTGDDGDLTHTGDLVGTLRYMAPERLRGESDPRADVYSLGVTLYELLTLRPAFPEADRARLIEHVAHAEPPAPRRLDPAIPRDLETIVLTAMAKEPRGRYASAAAFADDLQRFLDDRPIRARRAAPPERAWRWCRRNPRLAGLAAVAGALLLVILVGSPLLLVRLWDQRRRTVAELAGAQLARAESQRLTNQAGRRFTSLASLDHALSLMPPDPRRRLDLRNAYIACLGLADLGVAHQWHGYPHGSAGVCFDARLELYARSDDAGAITVRRVADDSELARLPGHGLGAWTLRFSPDGRYLAAGYQKRFRDDPLQFCVWDCKRGTALLKLPTTAGCGEADFTPDSRFVAISCGVGRLSIHDLSNPNSAPRPLTCHGLAKHLAYAPTGRQLAITLPSAVQVLDAQTGQVVESWPHPAEPAGLAWRADGRLLAAACGTLIYFWEPGTKDRVGVLTGHEDAVTELAFSHRGDLLASKAHDGTVRLWDVPRRRQLVRTGSVYTGCAGLHFSTDDRRLGFASDGARLWLWNVATGDECRTLDPRQPGARAFAGAFSPDGRWLAIAASDGIALWDWSRRTIGSVVPEPRCWSAHFTPDGRWLIATGPRGAVRWPVTWAPLHVGDPERFGPDRPLERADLSRDSTLLVAAARDAPGAILRPGSPAEVPLPHERIRFVAVSPDGRLAASGTWYGSGVKIWDSSSGRCVADLPADASATVAFSPDGRWLVVGTEAQYAVYDPTSWTRHHAIAKYPENTPGPMSFTADGTMLAVRHAPSELRLLNMATGNHLASLQTPDQNTLVWHTLSRDGHHLAAGVHGGLTFVWDLAAIRRELAGRGLDWP